MNIRYRNAIYKSMVLNERVESWWIDECDKDNIKIIVMTYRGNKVILNLPVSEKLKIKDLIELMEKEIERGDK